MVFFLQFLVTGLAQGLIYALLALGFVIVLKCSKAFNVAQGQLVMIGAYLGYTFFVMFQFPVWLSLISAVGVAILMGLAIERFALRPMVGQDALAIIMVTMGLATVLEGIATLFWSGQYLTFYGYMPEIHLRLGVISLASEVVIGVIVAFVVVVILMLFFRYSRTGLAMIATAEDEQIVQSAGIRVTTVYAISWVIACVVGILGGILLGSQGGVTVQLSSVGMKALAVVLLGGMDSIGGAIVAGIMLGVLENIASGYLDPLLPAGGVVNVFPFIVMIVVLIFKPYGLFGTRRIERI
jgi:branched-chain amino acid transport system permease protein